MPTVDDLLGLTELGLQPVVQGHRPQRIRWVATSELADPCPYLKGGEVLLTTGMVDRDWEQFVREVAATGVAAIGFGVGLSHARVPEALIDAATRIGLHVLVVPEATPFIAISEAVAQLIAQEERDATHAAAEMQQKLTQAMTRPDGTRHALALLSRISDGVAGLVDALGNPVEPTMPGFEVTDATRRALATLRGARGRGAVSEVDPLATTIVQPVGPGAYPDSYLVLVTRGAASQIARSALVTTVALLSLDNERRRAAAQTELRLRDCAARLLLDGSLTAGADVAALLPGTPRVPTRVLVIRTNADAPTDAAVRQHLHRVIPTALTTDSRDDSKPASFAVLVDPAQQPVVEHLLRAHGRRLGVGTVVPAAAAESSDAAALTAFARTDQNSPVVRWAEMSRGGVRGVLGPAAARALSEQLLDPLAGSPELIDTLRCFLSHLGQWQPTAAALGIHRNTLRKRIARIEELTGRSLYSASARADFWVAVESSPGHDLAVRRRPRSRSSSGRARTSSPSAPGAGGELR